MIDIKKLLAVLGFGAVVGLLVGFMRGIIQYKHDGWGNFLRGIIASMLVAILIGFALDSVLWPDSMKAAITGAAAYVADDILVSLITLARSMSSDPTGFIQRWIPFFKKDKE